MKKKTTKLPPDSVADLKAEVDNLRSVVGRMRKEEGDTEQTNLKLNHIRLAMYDSLMLEREELMVRIRRIDQRVQVLGIEMPTATEEVIHRFAFDEPSRSWKTESEWKGRK